MSTDNDTNDMELEDFDTGYQKLEVTEEQPPADENVDVEVVDDTPPQDRNREPMPKEIVEELEKDDLDEYSEKVKKRMSQMKKVWHDERREKERATREREDALEFARRQHEENKQLRSQLYNDKKAYVETLHNATKNDYTTAKERFKTAYESGDPEAIIEAQEHLTRSQMALREIERYKPTLQREQNPVQRNSQAETAPQPDARAQAWREKNTWYGVDDEMTSLALGVHQKLVRSGVDPRTQADSYYRQLDATIRKRFPEYFGAGDNVEEPVNNKPATKAKPNVVAPVTRSTGPRRVQLTPSQVSIAKRLGISNEAYAREMLKMEGDR